MHPRLEEDDAARQRRVDHLGRELRRRLLRVRVAHELEREHRAEAADVADRRPAALPGVHLLADAVADDDRARDEALVLDDVEHRERRCLRHRVPDVRAADRPRVRAVHDLRAADHAREREARGDRLRHRDEVGLDSEVLHREHPARAPEARLHLVGDEDDPVAVAERPQPLDVGLRRRDEAALALLGLEDDRGDVLRRDVRLEHALELCERGDRVGPPVGVRIRRAVDLGRERPHPDLVRVGLRGHRQREQRPPVEAALVRDHGGTAGVQARELDRVLDRLRPGVEERRAGRAGDRDERAQPLGEGDVRLVRDDRVVRVEEALGLLGHRGDDARMRVTGVHDADPAGEVDEDVPVDVRDRRVLGRSRVDREVHTERRRDRERLALREPPRLGPRDLRLQPDRPRHRHRGQRIGGPR